MTSSMKKRRNKRQLDIEHKKDYDEQIVMWITTMFLVCMFVVYPLFMKDRYFDITDAKYLLFKVGVIAYSVLFVLAVLMRYLGRLSYKSGRLISDGNSISETTHSRKSLIIMIDISMLIFMISGFMAWIMAENKDNAFTGKDGRRCGLQFMIIVFIMYVCLAYGYELKDFVLPIFAVVSAITYIIGILQHLGFNPFNLLDRVRGEQRRLFISTFGNINTFASFICISMIFCMGMFIFESGKLLKVLYGAVVFIGGGALIAANSDSVYAGCGFAAICLLFIAIVNKSFAGYMTALVMAINGYIAMALVSKLTMRGIDRISGIGRASEHITILVAVDIVFIIILIAALVLRKKNIFSIKTQVIVAAVIVAATVVTVIGVGIEQQFSIFVFDDHWGSDRGFVWKRLIEAYKDFPVLNKLFGNGNESVKALMVSGYYDEMMDITGVVYDNAHNEYLQYLVTMGLFGVLSYLVVIIGAVVCGIRYGRKKTVLYVFATVILSYCAQAAFNLNQSITTPYVFLFVGLIAGVVRNMLQSGSSNEI
ncbi:MAG: O-antigen ligase family protein [Coprococcus sp.]